MNDRTEQLITRRLDGEITEEESLELDKRLIRSPEARAYMEEQARIDMLASEVVREACVPDRSGANAGDHNGLPGESPPNGNRRRYLRPIAAVAAAIAVALLVILLPSERPTPTGTTPLAAQVDQGSTEPAGKPVIAVPVDNSWSGLPNAGRHEVLGVYDDATQSLYLLEMSPRSGMSGMSAMDF